MLGMLLLVCWLRGITIRVESNNKEEARSFCWDAFQGIIYFIFNIKLSGNRIFRNAIRKRDYD